MAIETPRNTTEILRYGIRVPQQGLGLKMIRAIVLQETTFDDSVPQDPEHFNPVVLFNQQHYLTEARTQYIEKAVRNGVPLNEAFWMACIQE